MPLTPEVLDALVSLVRKAMDLKQASETPPMTLAEKLQLVVSVLTAVAAFFAVAATFRIHRLSAGQVHVSMTAAAYAPFAGAYSTRENAEYQMALEPDGHTGMELAQIVIENPGRHGVTVTDVKLRVEGTKKAHYAVAPRNFSLDRGANSVEPGTYFRVEPFDRATLWFDIWSLVDDCFAKDEELRTIQIWAEVRAAGHREPFSSTMKNPERKGPKTWEVQRSTLSFVGDQRSRRFKDLVVTELIRRTTTDLTHCHYMDDIGVSVGMALKEHGEEWTVKELKEAISEAIQLHYWALSEDIHIPVLGVTRCVWQGIEKVGLKNIDWGDIPLPATGQELDGDSPRALRPTEA